MGAAGSPCPAAPAGIRQSDRGSSMPALSFTQEEQARPPSLEAQAQPQEEQAMPLPQESQVKPFTQEEQAIFERVSNMN